MIKDEISRLVLLCVIAPLAISSGVAAPVRSEEPTVEDLIESVPDLTTDDDDLTAFSLRLTTHVPFDMPFETTATWRKNGEVGLLTTADDGKFPVWFLSGSQAAVFDVCSGKALIKEKARLKLDLRFSNDELKLDYGIASGDQDRVEVRLRALFDHDDFRQGSLARTPEGDLALTSRVSARGFRTTAVFDDEAPHSLRSLEIKRAKGGADVLRIDGLRFDEEVPEGWPTFPSSDEFPDEIDVLGPGGEGEAPDAYTQWLWMTRAQIAYASLKNPKWRDLPVVAGVDWLAATERSREFASFGKRLVPEASQEAVRE